MILPFKFSLCRYVKDEDTAAAAAQAEGPASESSAPAPTMKKVVAIQVPNMQLLEMIKKKIVGQAGGGTQWMNSEDGRRRVQVTVRFAKQARRASIHITERCKSALNRRLLFLFIVCHQ